MAAGYPGFTRRYARLAEVKNTFDWRYPATIDMLDGWVQTITETAPEGSDARIKYESLLAGLNNYRKNLRGQIDGAERVGLAERRREREAALNAWIESEAPEKGYAETLEKLDALSAESAQVAREQWRFDQAQRSTLLQNAHRLYRLSLERQKPDAERDAGYQERDVAFLRQRLEAMDRRFDQQVDRAVWLHFLEQYITAPESAHVAALDEAMGLPETWDEQAVTDIVERYYAETELGDKERRLALMEAEPAVFENSDDPFLQLAVALYDDREKQRNESEARSGRMRTLRPEYMEAIIAWQESQGYAAYPDANSTLRITYGTVMPDPESDPVEGKAFTTLEGILEKNTGEAPFNAPEIQLELIRQEEYGPCAKESLGTVPVNFMSDLDATGGNSGSATLNARGELVGLLFDTTIESVNADWDFDPRTTRTIHVDSRYMLWVMDKVDGAEHLITEMELVE